MNLLTSPIPSQRGITPNDIIAILESSQGNRRNTLNDHLNITGQHQGNVLRESERIQSALNTSAKLAEQRQARDQQLLIDTSNAVAMGMQRRQAAQRQREVDEQTRIEHEREEKLHELDLKKKNFALDELIRKRDEEIAAERSNFLDRFDENSEAHLEDKKKKLELQQEIKRLEKDIETGDDTPLPFDRLKNIMFLEAQREGSIRALAQEATVSGHTKRAEQLSRLADVLESGKETENEAENNTNNSFRGLPGAP